MDPGLICSILTRARSIFLMMSSTVALQMNSLGFWFQASRPRSLTQTARHAPQRCEGDFRESGWSGSREVYEHHYDLQRTGDPLTFDDLAFNPIETLAGPATTSSRASSN